MRYIPLIACLALTLAGIILAVWLPFFGGLLAGLAGIVSIIGLHDLFQTRRAVLKNYPISARLRFLFEHFRPEIRQYFLESDHEETPYSREQRALVYRRAKGIEGLRPFGTPAQCERDRGTSGSTIPWPPRIWTVMISA